MDRVAEAKKLFFAALGCQQKNDLREAERLYREALEMAPERPSILNNLATVLLGLGRHGEARLLCEKLLVIDAGDAAAMVNLGNCHLLAGAPEQALRVFDDVLQLQPAQPDADVGRASALRELGRPAEALAGCDKVLALSPDHLQALVNRGNALRDLKRHGDALVSFDRALAINPDFVQALYNRGNILRDLGRPADALTSFDRTLALQPDHIEALNNRGIALHDLARNDEAIASIDRALAIKPDYADALYNRGNWLMTSERYEKAIEAFELLLGINPQYEYAFGHFVHCKMHICAWDNLQPELADLHARVDRGERVSPPFPLLASSASPATQLQGAKSWVAAKHPPSATPLWDGVRYQHGRIRIAYVSAELREHATSYLIAELFELHDKTRFETFAIATGRNDGSPMRKRLERAFEHFIDAGNLRDEEVASLIRAHEIDILVDLNGYFGGTRTGIFALRPAPVQVNYLGFPGTMGAGYIDYIIGDRRVIPEGEQQFYCEHVVHLPDSYQSNDTQRKIAARTPTRAEAGLPDAGFVFCCFNNNHKILPDMFDVWMRILKEVDASVLWLLQGNASAPANLRREAAARGVAPDRIIFAPRVDPAQHLARHRLAGLFLDTLPHNAHTTASDALWAGVPLLTCEGTTFAGRVAASLLNALGLPELITSSREGYAALALKLATDAALLESTTVKLAKNRTTYPLFDIARFRRHIEAAYMNMWERSQRGESPSGFAVKNS